MARIGILALQGAFAKHAEATRAIGHDVTLVRDRADFDAIDGLILPGGESTVQLKLIAAGGLDEALVRTFQKRIPILATCAGLILIARTVTSPNQRSFNFIDVGVVRNGFGRQVESFETLSDEGLAAVFIRAPRIVEIGRDVSVLARLRGEPILVRQNHVTCATFHPELTSDRTVHEEVFGRAVPRQDAA